MTLDEAFQHFLTANTKGLQLSMMKLVSLAKDVKDATEQGDLAALKTKLADMRGHVGKLDKIVGLAISRAEVLARNEKGGFVDLSIPPMSRKRK